MTFDGNLVNSWIRQGVCMWLWAKLCKSAYIYCIVSSGCYWIFKDWLQFSLNEAPLGLFKFISDYLPYFEKINLFFNIIAKKFELIYKDWSKLFNLFAMISCDYLNLSLANEYVGDVTIPTQVIKYNQNFLQADQPIRLQYSNQIE
jgi:hypothetical protein